MHAQSHHILCDPMESMGFSRQDYWSGLSFPSPGDLPNPGIKPGSPALQQILYHLSHRGSPDMHWLGDKTQLPPLLAFVVTPGYQTLLS